MTTDSAITAARAMLEELLGKMGIKAKVSVVSEEPPTLDVSLDEPGSLIGHRGEGIRSLQHVLRLLLWRAGHDLPVVIDIDGYRARHEEHLKELAKRKAEEVRGNGRLAVLAPMTSYERRVVHVALKEEDGVTTESLGEGANRRVMIKKAE